MLPFSNMCCSHIVNNAHVQLAAVEYLNISGLVIDFATSPVRTGNSFFDKEYDAVGVWVVAV